MSNTDTNPEPMRVLEDPVRMRDVLQRHLRTLPGGCYEIQEVQLVNLRRRDGSLVEIAEESVVAAKVVPDPPAR